jgi:DNA-binding NarL/FixJ family response regulator
MIKLAVVIHDEKYLQKLINRLHNENDIKLPSALIIEDFKSEAEKVIAFMEQMVKQPPDILLFEQAILRDVAALDLEKILNYMDKIPTVKVIIVGIRFNEENVMAMMQGGVRGFFRFALDDEQLIRCIRTVAMGDIWLEANLITPVFDEFIKEFMKKKEYLKSLNELNSAKLDMLSHREMEIMELISHSLTNEEIADKLFISPKTVKTHLRNIFVKAEIKNRVEAALLYTRYAFKSQ